MKGAKDLLDQASGWIDQPPPGRQVGQSAVMDGSLRTLEPVGRGELGVCRCRAALKTENVGNGVDLLHLNRFFRTFGADKKAEVSYYQ